MLGYDVFADFDCGPAPQEHRIPCPYCGNRRQAPDYCPACLLSTKLIRVPEALAAEVRALVATWKKERTCSNTGTGS